MELEQAVMLELEKLSKLNGPSSEDDFRTAINMQVCRILDNAFGKDAAAEEH